MRRVAIVAGSEEAALHGTDGSFAWGDARIFEPGDDAALAAWEPGTVFSFDHAPDGPWRTIVWGRDVGVERDDVWRRAPRPAADALAALRGRPGAGVVVAGGGEAARESVLAKLAARRVEAWGAAALSRADLGRAAVVALLGAAGAPLADAALAALAAGRVLVAPRAQPAFGLIAWSDHLPYDNEDELACSADMAQSFPDAFEPLVAMGVLAAQAHLASAVYGRLAIDAELEDARSASASA